MTRRRSASVDSTTQRDGGREGLDRAESTIDKRYNAEIHSQTAIEVALELPDAHGFDATDIEKVEVAVFDVAHRIIGGGEEGDKTLVFTKEDADHSLPHSRSAPARTATPANPESGRRRVMKRRPGLALRVGTRPSSRVEPARMRDSCHDRWYTPAIVAPWPLETGSS